MPVTTLSKDDRKELLGLARASIAAHLAGTEPPAAGLLLPHLQEPGACFVSLHLEDALRGCIGTIEAHEPLATNVQRNARNAAFGDPRFPPLTARELPLVNIEISVLTAPESIPSAQQFEVGRHGVILELGMRRAVFLPQVAPEQGWDRETTLAHLARKAGLPPESWPEADLAVFEAIVFSEELLP